MGFSTSGLNSANIDNRLVHYLWNLVGAIFSIFASLTKSSITPDIFLKMLAKNKDFIAFGFCNVNVYTSI